MINALRGLYETNTAFPTSLCHVAAFVGIFALYLSDMSGIPQEEEEPSSNIEEKAATKGEEERTENAGRLAGKIQC